MMSATVEVITDQANTTAERETRRATRALQAYSQELAAMRLTIRGVSPTIMRPLNIDEVDVSTPSGRSAILLGMLSYFFIFALLTGGMNLAIDATAGERERGSLEPLLCLPVKRDHLIFGKIFAACLFMAISLSLSLTCFHFTLKFMPLQELGMTPNFGPLVVLLAFVLLVPFALVGAVADDARCVLHEELQGGTDLGQCRAAGSDDADPGRLHTDGSAEHRVDVYPLTKPAFAACRADQE